MTKKKCIILLSEKSSGSSACQNLLSKVADIRHVAQTRHFENETLYWTKAASVLELPQEKMLGSNIPLGPGRAREELIDLLKSNLENYSPPEDDKELIFGGWHLLCEQYAPIFFEKSPHHLFQWSALELIVECMERLDDVDFLLIGLVRNPMDMLYSAFQRWRSPPEKRHPQWLTSYQNLLKLKGIVGEKLVIVRYEDMIASLEPLQPVFDFCGVPSDQIDSTYLHSKSVQKWKNDKLFGFTLPQAIIELAEQYGYSRDELVNEPTKLWPFYRDVSRVTYKTLRLGKSSLRKVVKRN